MRTILRLSAFMLSLALAQPPLAQSQPVKIFGLVELSGTGTTSGTNFNDGVKPAVKESMPQAASSDARSITQPTTLSRKLSSPRPSR
jgi:hypothetical protein